MDKDRFRKDLGKDRRGLSGGVEAGVWMSRFLQLFLNYGLVLAILVWAATVAMMATISSRVALALGVHSAVAGGARDSGRHFLDTQIREEQYEGTAAGRKIQ